MSGKRGKKQVVDEDAEIQRLKNMVQSTVGRGRKVARYEFDSFYLRGAVDANIFLWYPRTPSQEYIRDVASAMQIPEFIPLLK